VPNKQSKKLGPVGKTIVGIVIAIYILFVGKCIFDITAFKSEPFSASLIEKVAKELVKEKLISPRSAKFSDIKIYTFKNDPKQFKAIGKVDSQNVFGAMIRKEFELVIRYKGFADDSYSKKLDPNNWLVISFNIW